MLILAFVTGILLVAVSGRMLARAAVVPRMHLKIHLREISDYGFETHFEDNDVPLAVHLRRAFISSARRTGRLLIARVPTLTPLSTSELNAAGFYDVEPEIIHGYRAFAAIGLPTVFGVLLFGVAGKVSFITILLVVVSLAGGWMGPSMFVRRRGSARLNEIDHRLPELIDLLIATVEAGMGFSASLQLVADRFHGALGEELKLTMRQQSLGMSIQGALDEMVERCDTPSIRAFVRTAARGESLGVSIGPVLRELSSDQRRRHRMAAREKMQKAPVKMIFPLMFLIMPALMIVLFYPAVVSLKGVF
jgi:Type II secretion system (T2SS), protein F